MSEEYMRKEEKKEREREQCETAREKGRRLDFIYFFHCLKNAIVILRLKKKGNQVQSLVIEFDYKDK